MLVQGWFTASIFIFLVGLAMVMLLLQLLVYLRRVLMLLSLILLLLCLPPVVFTGGHITSPVPDGRTH